MVDGAAKGDEFGQEEIGGRGMGKVGKRVR